MNTITKPAGGMFRIRLILNRMEDDRLFFSSIICHGEEEFAIASPFLSEGQNDAPLAMSFAIIHSIMNRIAPSGSWRKYEHIDGVCRLAGVQPTDDGILHDVGKEDIDLSADGDDVVMQYRYTLPETYSAFLAIERYLQANLSPIIVEKLSELKP